MATKTKMTTQEIQHKINADKCSLRNGIYKAKWFYFYSHEKTVEHYEAKVKQEFPGCIITKSSNNWNAWPKDTWFEVCFTIWPG